MIIALEEHYLDPELAALLEAEFPVPAALAKTLEDVGEGRIAAMDEAGIDVQILSHCPPGMESFSADRALGISRRLNDRLKSIVETHPTRFAAFAALPTAAPEDAADELERCVEKLGFKGALLNGLTQGQFLDDKRFWPIFERAEALGVPLYLHPSFPHRAVVDAYYRDYATSHPMFQWAAWGFTVEVGTQSIRLVLSGVFDAYPNLQFITGHMGETVPHLLYRIDETLARGAPDLHFREVYSSHFHVTTSAFFSDAALRMVIDELGIDRVMFSVDYPFASNLEGADWVRKVPLSDTDRRKIQSENARKLLRI